MQSPRCKYPEKKMYPIDTSVWITELPRLHLARFREHQSSGCSGREELLHLYQSSPAALWPPPFSLLWPPEDWASRGPPQNYFEGFLEAQHEHTKWLESLLLMTAQRPVTSPSRCTVQPPPKGAESSQDYHLCTRVPSSPWSSLQRVPSREV